MRKFFENIAFIAVLCACACCSFAADTISVIKEAKDGAELKSLLFEFISKDPKNSLVLCDCDGVQFELASSALQRQNIKNFLESYQFSEAQFNDILHQDPKKVVDPRLQEALEVCKRNGVPCFSFTACSTDSGSIQWRENDIESAGQSAIQQLSREESINDSPKKKLRAIIRQKQSQRKKGAVPVPVPVSAPLRKGFGQARVTGPVFQDSTLYSASAQKGDTLISFLNLAMYYPGVIRISAIGSAERLRVVFIDDCLPNLKEATEACKRFGIAEFLGIHFTAVENRPTEHSTYDAALRLVQAAFYAKHGIWPSDDCAKLLIEKDSNVYAPLLPMLPAPNLASA